MIDALKPSMSSGFRVFVRAPSLSLPERSPLPFVLVLCVGPRWFPLRVQYPPGFQSLFVRLVSLCSSVCSYASVLSSARLCHSVCPSLFVCLPVSCHPAVRLRPSVCPSVLVAVGEHSVPRPAVPPSEPFHAVLHASLASTAGGPNILPTASLSGTRGGISAAPECWGMWWNSSRLSDGDWPCHPLLSVVM